jgi:hypothetical protein
MFKFAFLCCTCICIGSVAQAQDIAGIEDCTRTSGLEKKTSCLQANINLLQQILTRHALDAQQRLEASRNEIIALKSAVTSLQARLEELAATRQAPAEKKPDKK